MSQLLDPFWQQAARHPERVAIIGADDQPVRFGALAAFARSLAAGWQCQGLQAGDRVLVARGMAPDLYAILIALWSLGAVAVFPEPAAGLAGLLHAVRVTRPTAHIGPAWLAPLCRWRPGGISLGRRLRLGANQAAVAMPGDLPADHPALITFTSGSTGQPKGIVRSHGFLTAQFAALAPLVRGDDQDVALVSLPMFLLVLLGLGMPAVIPAGPLRRPAALDPARLRGQMQRHGVTRLLAPPSICARLADAGDALPLRWIGTGGGPIYPDLLRRLQGVAPGADIHCFYGSTEAEPIAHQPVAAIDDQDWHDMAAGQGLLAGPPVPGLDLRLDGDEILVSGPFVNRGYLNPADDADTKRPRDGVIWHATGDAGRLDDQGRLWLLGRCSGRVAGLYPFAVETAALSWPGVRQAALVGIADQPILALAGAGPLAVWQERAAQAFPNVTLRVLPAIPLDRRHNAKVDYPALRRVLGD